MIGGGDHNAELGIAVQDAIAADARMKGADGLEAQRAWGAEYLGERMMGMGMALAVVATPMIFLHASPRLGVLWVGALFLAGMALVWARGAKAKDIETVRAAQLAAHRTRQRELAGRTGTGQRDYDDAQD